MPPPVFGDPAVALKNQLQADLTRINAASPAGSGVVHPPGTSIYGQQMSLTPEQRSAQIPIQNANIRRLESEWATADAARKRTIVKGIGDILRGFPGTSSAKLSEFQRQLGGRRRMTRRRKTRKHSRRQK